MRAAVKKVAEYFPTAIISGRSRDKVAKIILSNTTFLLPFSFIFPRQFFQVVNAVRLPRILMWLTITFRRSTTCRIEHLNIVFKHIQIMKLRWWLTSFWQLLHPLTIYWTYLTTYLNCLNHLNCYHQSCQILVVQIAQLLLKCNFSLPANNKLPRSSMVLILTNFPIGSGAWICRTNRTLLRW